MSALGIPPRTVAIIAIVLAAIGAAAILAGVFRPVEWIFVAALVIVAVINAVIHWRRARQGDVDSLDE